MPDDVELNLLLNVIENPTRRKILNKLAQEPHYPLQLSKKLGVSQQAVMKHLKVLEDSNLVESLEVPSSIGGPPRKVYRTTKRFSIRIDVGPNMFNLRFMPIEDELPDDSDEMTGQMTEILSELSAAYQRQNKQRQLTQLMDVLEQINAELNDIEQRRSYLIGLREKVLKQSYKLIADLFENYDERLILYYIIKQLGMEEISLASLSEALNIREQVLQELFTDMLKQQVLLGRIEELLRK